MKSSYKVIGLMSGTSLDGLDIAHCSFDFKSGKWHYELLQTDFVEYEEGFRKRLKESTALSAIDLLVLNNQYGDWLGEKTKSFIEKHRLKVDFVASHGHTVFHQIDKKITYQIGAGQTLTNTSGQKVICDFRSKDVSLNGQGAPLVPIGDRLLFSEFDFCLNLGGISNVSFEAKKERIAFDIAPVNMLFSHVLRKTDMAFDDRGRIARNGKLDQKLFNALNGLDFYKSTYPKSLGYEWFVEFIIPILDTIELSIEDKLHTCVHHVAKQIADATFGIMNNKSRMLVTGGGSKNDFLTQTIRDYLDESVSVEVPDDKLVDFKEALIFAFMGVLRDRNEINCLKSVTGATKDSCGGVVYLPFD